MFITKVNETFFGMSESLEASLGRHQKGAETAAGVPYDSYIYVYPQVRLFDAHDNHVLEDSWTRHHHHNSEKYSM